jgi:hypothetical protein
MGRIIGNSTETIERETEDYRETAGRLRERGDRPTSMHVSADAEEDARNTSRGETADYEWRRPGNMDAPPPRPGYHQRWVRASLRSDSDNINWHSKMREGWTPRDPSTVPDCSRLFGEYKHGNQAVIQHGGSILCEMPIQRIESKRKFIREEIRRQERSVEEETDKVSAEGVRKGFVPIVREETAQVTTGRRPATLAD